VASDFFGTSLIVLLASEAPAVETDACGMAGDEGCGGGAEIPALESDEESGAGVVEEGRSFIVCFTPGTAVLDERAERGFWILTVSSSDTTLGEAVACAGDGDGAGPRLAPDTCAGTATAPAVSPTTAGFSLTVVIFLTLSSSSPVGATAESPVAPVLSFILGMVDVAVESSSAVEAALILVLGIFDVATAASSTTDSFGELTFIVGMADVATASSSGNPADLIILVRGIFDVAPATSSANDSVLWVTAGVTDATGASVAAESTLALIFILGMVDVATASSSVEATLIMEVTFVRSPGLTGLPSFEPITTLSSAILLFLRVQSI
jgi:hypothetical protein